MTQSFEERYDKQISEVVRNEVLYNYNSSVMAEDSAKTVNNIIKSFIRSEIELARKEGYEAGYEVGRESVFSQGGMNYCDNKKINQEDK